MSLVLLDCVPQPNLAISWRGTKKSNKEFGPLRPAPPTTPRSRCSLFLLAVTYTKSLVTFVVLLIDTADASTDLYVNENTDANANSKPSVNTNTGADALTTSNTVVTVNVFGYGCSA